MYVVENHLFILFSSYLIDKLNTITAESIEILKDVSDNARKRVNQNDKQTLQSIGFKRFTPIFFFILNKNGCKTSGII